MNIQRGLERISAAWWGFFGLLAALAFVGGVIAQDWWLAGIGFGCIVASGVAHRVTCWVLSGFFSPS